MNKALVTSVVCFLISVCVGLLMPSWVDSPERKLKVPPVGMSATDMTRTVSLNTGAVVLGESELTITGLRARVADAATWQRVTNRTKVIRESFRAHAREVGSRQALDEACNIFSTAAIPTYLAESGLEVAAIACLESGGVVEADLAAVLSQNLPFARPLLRAFSLFSEPRTVVGAYSSLKRIVDLGGAKADASLNDLLLDIAVRSASTCSQIDLEALLEFAKHFLDEDAAVSKVAVAASGRSTVLALQFIRQQSARYPKRLARFVRDLGLPSAEFVAFCDSLSEGDLADFVSAYARDLEEGNPQLYTELAAAVGPSKLPEEVRIKVVSGLLRASGGMAGEWLEALPSQEQATVLIGTYDFMIKQPRFDGRLTRAWLESASMHNGLDETKLANAIQASAQHMEWEASLTYTKKLSPELRKTVETNLRLTHASKLALSGDRQALVSFLESASSEVRAPILGYVAATVATQSPESALEWYNETNDPTTKQALENAMLSSPNLTQISMETRRTWVENRIKDPSYLSAGSRAVNGYVGDLAMRDSSAALAFVYSIPASPLREEAFRSLAHDWAYRDPISASEWIVEMPPGRDRDFALSELTKASRSEPESAFVNVAAISDPKLRMAAANSVVNWWKARDATKMHELIEQSQLPVEDKRSLLQVLEK